MGKIVEETIIKTEWSGKNASKATKDKMVGGHCPARAWQKDAFKLLKDERFVILNAPTGSGKSWEMCLISTHKMELDSRLRTIIAVPQTIIGNGFLDAHIILPDTRKKIHWKPKHNLCDEQATANVDRVIAFLKSKTGDLSDRALVCTHATLLGVYKSLQATKQLRLLDNLMLWIDEAHHVKNVEMIDIEDATISNGIGNLAKHLLSPAKKNVHLGLATASFFRGDRCSLLTDAMERKFVRFNLPYDEYLASMTHLKSFSFSFMMGDHDYIQSIEKLLKKSKRKDIIHFPHPMHRHSRGDKLKDTADFKAFASKLYGSKETTTSEGLTILQKGKTSYKYLDLVDIENREAKKAFTQTINDSPEALDAILAIGMFKEGANWVFADRSIIVGHRDSLVDIVQMVGRLFRDCPGKEHVEVVNILPWSLDQTNREKFRENLNNYLKAVYALMILEDVLTPPTMFEPKKKREKKAGGDVEPRTSRFQDLVPDENKRHKLLDEGKQAMVVLADESAGRASHEEHVQAVKSVVERNGVSKAVSYEVARHVVLRHARRTLQARGYDVRSITIDLLESVNPVQWVVDFTNKNCGPKTFRELRIAISQDGTIPMPWELQKRLAREAFERGEVTGNLEGAIRHAREFNERVAHSAEVA